MIQLFLEMAGHQSSFATNGAEAVALFEDGGFDMVLMDISMPVMDG
ncbi:MAG: response regulator, partial [Rhodobacterales bacterium CG18_big_fil_WC_8_21_14_2_50_71_9]